MSSWAAKRRLIYFSIVAGFFLLVVAIPLFKIYYKAPTCFDGIQNQDEVGVDCGGHCQRLCATQALPPIVHWQRYFEVVPGIYSAVAYIENPNSKAGAYNVPYRFTFVDDKNEFVSERAGTVNIPPKKIFAVFESTISIPNLKPAKVTFEFTSAPQWDKEYPEEPLITVTDRELQNESTSPKLFVTLTNSQVFPLSNIEVTALISDTKGNVIAASQTFIDSIEKGLSKQAVFTWPRPFETGTRECQAPADTVLVIDRSGSMDDDGANPPQPLTDAKNAAASFVDKAQKDDQIGVVSFASAASFPPDALLSKAFSEIKDVVRGISILPIGSQNTNIGEGLKVALDELNSARHKGSAKKVIILLTDGEANLPVDDNDDDRPAKYAASIADEAKKSEIELYTIGLGSKVNQTFLKSIATKPSYFYSAVSSKDLEGIYGEISSAICKIGPSIIDIITRTNSR
jgi:Mg-chelatase subunit ChlD